MYKKIFCPIDGSETSNRGMAEATRFAKDQNAELCFCHVVDNSALVMYSPVIESAFEALRESGRKLLDAAVQQASAAGVSTSLRMSEIMVGRPADTIVEEAKRFHADLIVMGTHGRRGLSRLLLGSDALAVLTLSEVPVLLVK